MNHSVSNHRAFGAFLMCLVIVLDQATKNSVLYFVGQKGFVTLSPYFNIVCTLNKGMSFGMLGQGYWWQTTFILVAVGIASIWLFQQYWNAESLALSLLYSLVIGGAIGNLIDRAFHGAVIDFIDFHIDDIQWYPLTFHTKNWHWPAFNIADSTIVMGVFLLVGRRVWAYLSEPLAHKK